MVEDDRSLIFGFTLAFAGIFFAMLGFLMYRKYLTGDTMGSDSVHTKILKPGVENYGRMSYPQITPRSTQSYRLSQYGQQNRHNESFSNSDNSSSSDDFTLKSVIVRRPFRDHQTRRDQSLQSRSNSRSKNSFQVTSRSIIPEESATKDVDKLSTLNHKHLFSTRITRQ